MTGLGSEFGAMLHSSLSCAGADLVTSRLQAFAADTLAHVAIGMFASGAVLLRGWSRGWLWAGLVAICVKELLFDLPNGGWGGLIWFDSLWDVASYFVGFLAVWWALIAPETRLQQED